MAQIRRLSFQDSLDGAGFFPKKISKVGTLRCWSKRYLFADVGFVCLQAVGLKTAKDVFPV